MAQHTSHILLKVLAGIHAGGEFPLRDGAYIIGSGNDCDIVLSDDGVADIHARLVVQEGNFTLEVKSRPLYVDGKATRADAVSLHVLHVVTLGMAFFTIGEASTRWDTIVLPRLDRSASSDSDTDADDRIDQEDMKHTDGASLPPPPFSGVDPSSPGAGKAPFESGQTASMMATDPAGNDRHRPDRHRHMYRVSIGVALCAAFLIAWPMYQIFFSVPKEMPPALSLSDRVKHTIAGLGSGYEAVVLSPSGHSDGRLTLSGYVRDRKHYRRLVEALAGAGENRNLHMRVNVGTSMAEWIADDLISRRFHIKVKDLGHGKFEISGIVDDPAALQDALSQIRQQMPEVKDIEEHIISTQHIVDVVKDELRHQGVRGDLSISGTQARIEAAGFLDEKDFSLWRKVVGALRHMYGSALEIRDKVENVPGLNLPIRSVVRGPHSFVVLTGKGYFSEGMQLPNGFRLDTISQDYLLLSRDGRTYKYLYGGYNNG